MSTKKEERKEETTVTTSQSQSPSQTSEQQQQVLIGHYKKPKIISEKHQMRQEIQIPRYTQAVNDYQEQTIQATREIADNSIDSQKEIINSFQSALIPQLENANRVLWSNWVSPRRLY